MSAPPKVKKDWLDGTLAFAATLAAFLFVIWTVYGSLKIGGSEHANARIASALSLAALIPAALVAIAYMAE